MQVAESATSLNSTDAFVLLTADKVFTWVGKYASEAEKKMLDDVVADVLNGKKAPPTEALAEGAEPEAFWTLLGGKQPYPASSSDPPTIPPKMFLVSDVYNKGAGVSVEYIP